MKTSKLVRDNIPTIIKASGMNPSTHIADPKEYYDALITKLSEEVTEFIADQNIEEIADIIEVLWAIAEHKDFKWNDIEMIRLQKREQKGGFSKRIILES